MGQIEQFLYEHYENGPDVIRVRRYIGGEVDEHIDPEAISELLAVGRSEPDTLIWVDVESPTPADIALLSGEFDVHRLAAEDLLHARQRPKLEQYHDHHFLVARDCTIEGGRLVSREIDILFARGWLLSVRKPSESGDPPVPIEEAVLRFEAQRSEPETTNEGFLLYVILDALVDRYFEVTDSVDDLLEAVEEAVFTSAIKPGDLEHRIYRLRQVLVSFRRSAAPLREVLTALFRMEEGIIGPAARTHLQDVYDHLLRATEVNEAQRDMLTAALESHLAIVSNHMNEVMKKMTSWGAILVSATLVTGVYGMNFRLMPELDWRFGYPIALATMVGLMIGLHAMFKRRDWL